jgi:hypothetical protein
LAELEAAKDRETIVLRGDPRGDEEGDQEEGEEGEREVEREREEQEVIDEGGGDAPLRRRSSRSRVAQRRR